MNSICEPNWCVGGDFNIVRFSHEKFPQERATRSMRRFDEFIKEAELRDIPLVNGKFTWLNFREVAAKSRIDRFLFSNGWEGMLKEVRQEIGLRVCLDHFPLILDTAPVSWGSTPFRFENMWLGHPTFRQECEMWWRSISSTG